jgi:hypothetical protein
LSSEFVSCISEDKSVEINEDSLKLGTNEFMFIVDDGNFLISDISLRNDLEKEIFPSYSFDVNSKNEKDFIMFISFDSNGLKSFNVKLNGEIINVETTSSYFEQDITNFIKVGKNNIELVSDSELKIDKLEVRYE